MFDVPVDAWYVWIGVSAVSVVAFGVVVALPTTLPPDATATARAVDAVAVGPPGSQTSHELAADRIRLGEVSVGLAGSAGRSHAAFTYPIVPALDAPRLRRVASGTPPSVVFETETAFSVAIRTAERTSPAWRPAPSRLEVRHVEWGETRVTLVG